MIRMLLALVLAFGQLLQLMWVGPPRWLSHPLAPRPPAVFRFEPPPGAARSTPILVCAQSDSAWVMGSIPDAKGGGAQFLPDTGMIEIGGIFDDATRNDPWVTDTLPPDFGPVRVWTVRAFDRGRNGAIVSRGARRVSAAAMAREGGRARDRVLYYEDRRTIEALRVVLASSEPAEDPTDSGPPPGWPGDPAERRRLLLADDGVAHGKPEGRRFYLDLSFHHAGDRATPWSLAVSNDPRWPRTDLAWTLVSVDDMRTMFDRVLELPALARGSDRSPSAADVGMTYGEFRILVHVPNSDRPHIVYDTYLSIDDARVVARSLAGALERAHPSQAGQLQRTAILFPSRENPRRRWGD